MFRGLLAAITFMSAIIIFGLIIYGTDDQAGLVPLTPPESAPGTGGLDGQSALAEENARLRARVAELEAELNIEKREATQAGWDLQVAQTQKTHVDQAYQALKAHGEKQAQDLAKLQAVKSQLEKALAASEGDLKKAKNQIQELNGSLEKANTHIKTLEADLETEWTKLAEANTTISQLETYVVNKQVELNIAASQIVQLKGEIADAKLFACRALLWTGGVFLPFFSMLGSFGGYLSGRRSILL